MGDLLGVEPMLAIGGLVMREKTREHCGGWVHVHVWTSIMHMHCPAVVLLLSCPCYPALDIVQVTMGKLLGVEETG
jgi:hypothetical protein